MDLAKIRFSKEHEWVDVDEDSGLTTVGITDFAAGELGDIVFIELPEVGREVRSKESIGTIEAVKTVADLYAPVSGVVKEINERLEDDPGLVNKSPYEEGWFLKLQITNQGELGELMNHDEYARMTGTE